MARLKSHKGSIMKQFEGENPIQNLTVERVFPFNVPPAAGLLPLSNVSSPLE